MPRGHGNSPLAIERQGRGALKDESSHKSPPKCTFRHSSGCLSRGQLQDGSKNQWNQALSDALTRSIAKEMSLQMKDLRGALKAARELQRPAMRVNTECTRVREDRPDANSRTKTAFVREAPRPRGGGGDPTPLVRQWPPG
jgi:hypothetical protein